MKQKNLWLKILTSAFLSILLVLFVNLGIKLFYPEPEYPQSNCDKITMECDQIDYTEYDKARASYENNIFYILAVIGLIAISVGLFIPSLNVQITGISSGFILIIEGMIRNYHSTVTLFITSGILIIVIIYMIYKFQRR